MGPLLPENDGKQEHPDRRHILQDDGRSCSGEFDGNDIQDTGDAHHQGRQDIGLSKAQAEASFDSKEHEQGNDAPERNDGHGSPGDGLHAYPGESPQQCRAEYDQPSGCFVVFIGSFHFNSHRPGDYTTIWRKMRRVFV